MIVEIPAEIISPAVSAAYICAYSKDRGQYYLKINLIGDGDPAVTGMDGGNVYVGDCKIGWFGGI